MLMKRAQDQHFPLTMAGEGEKVKIVMLKGGKHLGKRLSSLGLNVDSEIVVVQREGTSLVLARSESRFALGAAMAHKIMVCPISA